jgi:hypothetical protein
LEEQRTDPGCGKKEGLLKGEEARGDQKGLVLRTKSLSLLGLEEQRMG